MNWHNAQDLRERIDALEDVIRELTDAEKYGVPGGYRDRGFDWPYRDWCTYCLRSWAREEQEQHDDEGDERALGGHVEADREAEDRELIERVHEEVDAETEEQP